MDPIDAAGRPEIGTALADKGSLIAYLKKTFIEDKFFERHTDRLCDVVMEGPPSFKDLYKDMKEDLRRWRVMMLCNLEDSDVNNDRLDDSVAMKNYFIESYVETYL